MKSKTLQDTQLPLVLTSGQVMDRNKSTEVAAIKHNYYYIYSSIPIPTENGFCVGGIIIMPRKVQLPRVDPQGSGGFYYY